MPKIHKYSYTHVTNVFDFVTAFADHTAGQALVDQQSAIQFAVLLLRKNETQYTED